MDISSLGDYDYCGGCILHFFDQAHEKDIIAEVKRLRHCYGHYLAFLANLPKRDYGRLVEPPENQNTKYGPILKSLGFKFIGRERNPNTGNMCYAYMATKSQLKFPEEKKEVVKKKARTDYWKRGV